MKHSEIRRATFIAAVAVVTFLTVGVPAAVEAQTTGLRVNVPFEFQVGDQILPPGTYSVWLRGSGAALSVADGKGQSALSITNAIHRPSARNASESLLIFSVYGDRYFLNEVRWAGYTEARALLKSKSEIQLAKSRSAPSPSQATIAATTPR